jgi:hypothetical protein
MTENHKKFLAHLKDSSSAVFRSLLCLLGMALVSGIDAGAL